MIILIYIDFKLPFFWSLNQHDGLKRNQTRPLRAEVQEIAIAKYSGGQLKYVGDIENGKDFVGIY